MRPILLILCALFTLSVQADPQQGAQILQLVDYIGVDYSGAVLPNGQLKSDTEYAEMKEFAATIERLLIELPRMTEKTVLQSKAKKLVNLIDARAKPEEVQAMAKALSKDLRDVLHLEVTPERVPDVARGAALYQENCSACHGAQGKGDGEMAQSLDPRPTNFHDRARVDRLSSFAFYNTITLGVNGTGMASYGNTLSDIDRWDLALYLSGLSATDAEIARGQFLWDKGENGSLTSLQALTLMTLNEVRATDGAEGPAIMAYLRAHPEAITEANPFTITLNWLDKSLNSYIEGDKARAYQEALLAYLEGFETAEAVIDVVDGEKTRIALEGQLGAYRQAIEARVSVEHLRGLHAELVKELKRLRQNLPETKFSRTTVFASSFIILLREGLESILIIGMLVMMIIKAERRQLLQGVHLGWMLALAAGVGTWWLSHELIHITGAMRELAEGVTALIAAGILLYVGLWMHTHNIAHDWRSYLRNRLNKHLQEEAWFGLTLLSFLAVYREVFETILFYEALALQVGPQGIDSLLLGILAAITVLLVVVFLMVRYSLKLPLQSFFKVTSVMIFVFAIIFVGQGIHSLEEAGQAPVWTIHFPRIDILGIYPNAFGLIIQGIILLIALLFMMKRGKK